MSADDGPGTREVAHRLFAAEFEDADYEYSESDEERAPNYVVTPTGARVNRLFVVGVLTEVEAVNENTLRGRAVDPTGAFVTYAGQYQPDEVAFLDRTTPPAFVALTGKARTFQPDDSEIVYTSVRPERLSEVDADTRDRWTVSAAEATLRRVAVARDALRLPERGDQLRERLAAAGVRPATASGVAHALDHYETGERYLEAVRRLAVQTLEVVAGERDEVEDLTVDPSDPADATVGPFPEGIEGLPADTLDQAGSDDDTATVGADDTTAADAGTVDQSPASESPTTEQSSPSSGQSASASGQSPTSEQSAAPSGQSSASEQSAAPSEQSSSPSAGETTTASDDSTAEPVSTQREPESADSGIETDEPAATGGSSDAGSTGEQPTTATIGETDDDSTTIGGFDDSDDELGGFETGGLSGESSEDAPTDDESFGPGDDTPADDESFESGEEALTDEEREAVESEYGVGFSSGSEVPNPEESELDAPDPEEITPDPDGELAGESEPDRTAGSDDPADSTTDSQEADVDLSTTVVEIMGELDEGSGASREEVLALAVDRHGVEPEAVEEAIQDALMGGQCYEASDGLKPI